MASCTKLSRNTDPSGCREGSPKDRAEREYRTKRVKDAKNEAQKEIEEYRKQKEEEFKKYETEHKSGNKKAEEEASKDADEKLKGIKDAGAKGGDKVIEDLLRVVMDVEPEVPDRVVAPPA
ncbi:hypothetical protein MMC19_005635 [Ptychographa xylographoides]|nr:hypothetical protein [Ptychographa xylographoides]